MNRKSKNSVEPGFSVLELMVVLVIVALLTAMAYPAYQRHVITGFRTRAQADLLALAQIMEQRHLFSGAYTAGTDAEPNPMMDHSPADEAAAQAHYRLMIELMNDQQGYRLRAIPVSGTPSADDGELDYFSDGRTAWDRNNDGQLSDDEYQWH